MSVSAQSGRTSGHCRHWWLKKNINLGGNNNGDSAVNFDGVGVYPAHVNRVLDITIAYPDGKQLDLGAIVTAYRKPCKTFLFYRLFPCREVRIHICESIVNKTRAA
jgi:hypothetical protein